jgi:hypothetical protein
MRRVTVTLTDELDQAIEEFRKQQPATPSTTAVVQAAIRRYFAELGYNVVPPSEPFQPLVITPAEKGSGFSDTSINHDQVIADSYFDR